MHNDTVVTNDVLFVNFRNHTVYIVGPASAGQIPVVHDGPGGSVRRHNNHGAQRALQKAEHAQNGVLGEEDLHTAAAQTVADESARPVVSGPGGQQSPAARRQEVETERGAGGGHVFGDVFARLSASLSAASRRVQRPSLVIRRHQQIQRSDRSVGRIRRLQRLTLHGRIRRESERRNAQEEVPVRTGKGDTQREIYPASHTETGRI